MQKLSRRTYWIMVPKRIGELALWREEMEKFRWGFSLLKRLSELHSKSTTGEELIALYAEGRHESTIGTIGL